MKIASSEPLGYNEIMTVSRESRQGKDNSRHPGPSSAPEAAPATPDRRRHEKIALTPGRRRILDILAREGRPLGAYDLIDRVGLETGKRPAPISIYRALDFLLENGLVHRLASRNTFLACGHAHEASAPIVFLICENCGEVVEATSESFRGSLAGLAAEAEFSPRATVMEVAGRCRACAESTLEGAS